MTILITGVAGFIGSFLAESLIQNGYKVFGIDNLFRGKMANIQHLPKASFQFCKLDLSHPKQIKRIHKILLQHHITTIFHLAAINGTQHFYDHPFFVLDQNIKITQNLLASIPETAVNYIIYTSSSEVYGDATQFPTPETYPISVHADFDRDSYAASKAVDEFYVHLFSQLQKIDHLILRVFNTYGGRMIGTRYGQVIPELIQKIHFDKKFTIIGDGRQTRSFCYVQDLIWILKKLMQKQVTGLMNVGNDDEISIAGLAQQLHQLTSQTYAPTFLPGRPHDHQRRKPDISQLRKTLPELRFTSLDQGLTKTLEFYKQSGLK
jgi:UDP-glucuronate decarboxylase